MDEIKKFVESLRQQIGGTDESPETMNLRLTRGEFIYKMLKEDKGWALLDLMEDGEHPVCERLGLCRAYIAEGTVYFEVPRWNNLVSHLKICHSVFSREEA